MRAKPLAVFATQRLQRHRQQHLLAQRIFEQQSFALVIPDLGLGVSDRKLFVPSVGSEWAVQQIETALHGQHDRLKTTGASDFEVRLQLAFQPDVLHYLVLAVMLLNQVGPALAQQRRSLPYLFPEVDHTRTELLPKIERVKL